MKKLYPLGLIAATFAAGLWLAPSLALLGSAPAQAQGDPQAAALKVGPTRDLKRPSEAARLVKDGATVEIDAGDYHGDVAVWRANHLTLRGVGGRARIFADGRDAEGKAIWVIKGNQVLVEGIALSGARVPHHNGAGIRAEGAGLTLRDCRIHGNEMGILTSNNPASVVVIEGSEFDHNTTDYATHGKLGHNIYIGRIARFILRDSQVHGARVGHQVKTRARVNLIHDNRIEDGDGSGSYLVDLAEGGEAEVRGNRFHKGPRAENPNAISFAPEARDKATGHQLRVIDNQFTNEAKDGNFVRNFSEASVELRDNRITGATPLQGPGRVE